MKSKGIRKTLALVAAVSLVAVIFLSGCGSSVNAEELLQKSQADLGKITSAKLQMDMNVDLGESMNMVGDYTIEEVKEGPGGLKLKIAGKAEVAGMGQEQQQELEGYYQDGTLYVYESITGKWYKQESLTPQTGIDQMGMGSIDDLQVTLEHAQDAKVTSEDSDSYTVSFSLGDDYYEDFVLKRAEEQSAAGMGGNAEMLKAWGTPTMDMTARVDKKTGRIIEMTGTMTYEDVPQVGDFTTEYTTTLVEVNEPIEIELPPEAFNAEPMPTQ